MDIDDDNDEPSPDSPVLTEEQRRALHNRYMVDWQAEKIRWYEGEGKRVRARLEAIIAEHFNSQPPTEADVDLFDTLERLLEESGAVHLEVLAERDRMRTALEEIRTLCSDRQRFVLLGPRGFAAALQICERALGYVLEEPV